MRLTCPNCGAQYEVPDEVIPTHGRDVQCSNCGTTWFQAHPDAEEAEAPPPPPPPPPQPDPEPDYEPSFDANRPPRRELDPDVRDVLREEAAREAEARAAEGLESQPELGLDDTPRDNEQRAREARERMARRKGEAGQSDLIAAAAGTRRDLLPDIDDINDTLGPRDTTAVVETDSDLSELRRPPKARREGFRFGFYLTLLIGAGAIAAYHFAPEIIARVPEAEPYLTRFVAEVNEARFWLDDHYQSGMAWLKQKAAENGL